MKTKFCRTCGQANLLTENTCTKCGLNLPPAIKNTPGESSSESNEDPYKTIAVGQEEFNNLQQSAKNFEPKPVKSNSKIFWIVGILGAFVVFGGFLIVALAGGIYFYAGSQSDKTAYPTPSNEENTNQDSKQVPKVVEENDPILLKMTDEDISKHINGKLKKLGQYTLGKTGTPKIKIFEGAKAEQFGIYLPKTDGRDFVFFTMATFTSYRKAKEFLAKKSEQVKKEGGKIISHDIKNEREVLIFKEKELGGQIMDCSQGVCISVFGTTGKHTSEFYKAYYKRP